MVWFGSTSSSKFRWEWWCALTISHVNVFLATLQSWLQPSMEACAESSTEGGQLKRGEKPRPAILQNRVSLYIGTNLLLLQAKLFTCYRHKSRLILTAVLPVLLLWQHWWNCSAVGHVASHQSLCPSHQMYFSLPPAEPWATFKGSERNLCGAEL